MTATLQPLQIDVAQFGVAGQHLPAIASACARGLQELTPAVCLHDGTLVVVGSGPSLPASLEEIKQERMNGRAICAVNGAHDFLCEHDVIPDLFLTVDPRDIRHNLKHKNAQTVYMLASRAAPEVFDHLQGCKIALWHSYGKADEFEHVKTNGAKFIIGGGPTSGLRAISVGYLALGYRNFILFGMDSCNDAQGRKRFDSGTVGVNTDVIVGGRTFICNMAMADQANSFERSTYQFLPGIHIDCRGDGLLAAIIAERKKMGKHT